jgi:hypothetical protein
LHDEKTGKKTILEVFIDGVSVDLSADELQKLRDLFNKDLKSVLDAKNPALSTMISSMGIQKRTPS